MSRTESFTVGVAMITVALAVLIGSQKIAGWFLLVAGVVVIASPYWQDWRYGEYRPNIHEINDLSSEQYKRRLLDPKFKKWVERQARKHPTKYPISRVEGDEK